MPVSMANTSIDPDSRKILKEQSMSICYLGHTIFFLYVDVLLVIICQDFFLRLNKVRSTIKLLLFCEEIRVKEDP